MTLLLLLNLLTEVSLWHYETLPLCIRKGRWPGKRNLLRPRWGFIPWIRTSAVFKCKGGVEKIMVDLESVEELWEGNWIVQNWQHWDCLFSYCQAGREGREKYSFKKKRLNPHASTTNKVSNAPMNIWESYTLYSKMKGVYSHCGEVPVRVLTQSAVVLGCAGKNQE